jgi:hypothetical protein
MSAAVQCFERTLTAPASDPAWRHGVATGLAALRAEFHTHVGLTEGPDGLYAEVLWDAPRLVHHAHTLGRDHRAILTALDEAAAHLDAEPDRLRDRAGELLSELARHRQRGADLVHAAYATDLGGEN